MKKLNQLIQNIRYIYITPIFENKGGRRMTDKELKDRCEVLEGEHVELEKKISKLKFVLENKTADYDKLEKENQDLKAKIDELKSNSGYVAYIERGHKIYELEKENEELKEQIEKMKCCQNCSHLCSRCELGIDGCYVCSKWELRRR